MKNYVVLYNPLANNGKAEGAARKLESVLTDGEVRFVDISSLGSFYDFFISCDDDCIVILTGGDGTLHHFVNDTRGLKIKQKIYYYGAGSGNDFLNDLLLIIQKIINDVIAKLKDDDQLLANFKSNPTKVLEKLVGVDLPDDKIDPIIDGIMAKLKIDDLAEKAEGIMGALGGLFGKG